MKTYGELREIVSDTLNREDLEANMPRWVKLTEAGIFRVLRTRDNEFTATIIATDPDDVSPEPVTPSNPIELPDNYLEMLLITVDGTPLQRISDAAMATMRKYDRSSNTNRPTVFSETERKLIIHPWPDDPGADWNGEQIVLKYYGSESLNELAPHNLPTNPLEEGQQIEATADYTGQSAQNTTRALQRFPDAYLYGVLFHASVYLQAPPDQQGTYNTLFRGALGEIRRESRRSQFSGSTLSVRNRDGEISQHTYTSTWRYGR